MNTLYYGDNLDIMREYVPDASVDLVYLVSIRPNLADTSEKLKKAARIKREKGKEEKLPLDGN